MAEAELVRVLSTPEGIKTAGSVAKKGISGVTILVSIGLFLLVVIVIAVFASKAKKSKQKATKQAGKAATSGKGGKSGTSGK